MPNDTSRQVPEGKSAILPLIVGVVIYSVVLCISYL